MALGVGVVLRCSVAEVAPLEAANPIDDAVELMAV
jgi:hypothetical protein